MRRASASTSRPTAASTGRSSPTRASATRRTLRQPGQGLVPRPRDQRDRRRPEQPNHIFVGSAQAVRGLSHVIGAGGTSALEPGANAPGVYESTDGGATFTEVWDGNDAGLVRRHRRRPRPAQPERRLRHRVRRRALWRRDAGAAQTAFQQVFTPAVRPAAGTDRTMFAPTIKNGHTRIYLTDGTANADGPAAPHAANFWRHGQRQPAGGDAARVAGRGLDAARRRRTPSRPSYTGWQMPDLDDDARARTSRPSTSAPAQCWYDEDVYTPAGMPDTVYVIGSNQYGEQPCDTKGVGCGNGRSNGREVLYSNTAGDPDAARTAAGRSPTCRTTRRTPPAPWCAYAPYFDPTAALHAPNGIHPDQHAIVDQPGQPDPDLRGLGRRRDPHERRVRRHLVPVRRAVPQRRRPAADHVGQLPDLQAAAVPGADGARATSTAS